MAPQLEPFFKQVDDLSGSFIDRLRKAVAIPSISAQDENRPDVFRMAQFLASELEALGAQVEQRPLGKQPGKEHLDLPPVVVARYGNDPNKRTILVYGHYDVQPALKEDGWATEPFELSVDSQGRMFGRGSTDDKGPVLGWLNVIEAHKKAGVEFPVNLLCCFEGMEEYGSEGLEEFIQAESKKFFKDADAAEFAKLNSKNKLDVWLQHDGKWWVASPKHWNFTAASKAVKQVFGVEPDLTREGGSIPVTLSFEQATGKNVLLLPMGSSTDAAHSINEKLDRRNYIEGIKLLGAYLHYVAEEPMNA
ncbi:hypothetical protein ATERTT37_000211 [Aspergillus terreus]